MAARAPDHRGGDRVHRDVLEAGWNALEGEFELKSCHPLHVRAIPGSKTDRQDGRRITELLAYGKLPESFIPPRWQRELR